MTFKPIAAALLLLELLAAPAAAATITVSAGGNLQAAVTAAKPGDEIVVAAGARFVGSLVFPAKPFGPVITIRSSAALPDRRIGPADLPLLPSIAASAGAAAITIDHSDNWKLDGLNLEPTTTAEILAIQSSSNVTLDRILMVAGAAGQRRGIRGNGRAITLRRSYVARMWSTAGDSQAFAAWDGAGPYTITDNYLEAASENVLFGGADSSSAAEMPADLLLEGNTLTKPLEWQGAGKGVKNLFELKAMRHARIRRNLFENNWIDGQAGSAIVFTPRNQEGTAPWTQVEDVVFELNIIRNSPAIFNVLGYDDTNVSAQTTGIVIRNNLAIGSAVGGRFALLTNEIGSITLDHNTYIQSPPASGTAAIGLYAEGKIPTATGSRPAAFAVQSLTITNNVITGNAYGLHTSFGMGAAGLAVMARAFTWRENVIGGTVAGAYPPTTYVITPAAYAALFKPDTWALVDGSVYRKAGTDGADLGWAGQGAAPSPPACSVSITATPPDAAAGWTVTVTFTRGATSATCGGA